MAPISISRARRALVTGANTGLGQAIAVALAEAGADIVAVGRSLHGRDAGAVAATGRRFQAIAADLATLEPIERIVDGGLAMPGGSTSWSTMPASSAAPTRSTSREADWDAVMDVNLKSVFFLSQAVARRMLADGARRQDHQHRLAAVLPGRHPDRLLHGEQERPRRPDPAAGLRVGRPAASTSTPSRRATS